MSCSPRRRIRLVTVVHGSRLIKPGRADFASVDLAPATGVRTTRFCRPRKASFALRVVNRSRKNRPATTSRARRCRVHRIPHPTSVTIAIRPSDGCGMPERKSLIWGSRQAERDANIFRNGARQPNDQTARPGKSPPVLSRLQDSVIGSRRVGPDDAAARRNPIDHAPDFRRSA
jgi:hypothetical protein